MEVIGLALKDYNQSQNIYLGKKMRIRKHNFLQLLNDKILVIAKPVINGKKNVKAIINLFSKDQLSYSFELDYTILTKQVFEKIFKNQKSILIDNKEADKCLPNIDIINIDNYNFKVKIYPFNINHCLGHFEDYPIVPSVLVLDCLIFGIKKWFQINYKNTLNLIIDSVELFLNKAMPIQKSYNSNILIRQNSLQSTMFLCEIKDNDCENYGNYIIIIENNYEKNN